MDLAYTIAITLLTLGILVAVHEYGHFWVARRCGVKVLRFSLGFGKPIYRWYDKHGTEFVVAIIPLGGYVKMLDEREGDVPADQLDSAFTSKSPLQRIAVVIAGPLANFALAIVAYWFLFMGGESGYAPIIGEVTADSIADIAGLEPGHEIVAVDGVDTPTWQAFSFRLLDRIGDTGQMRFSVKYPDSDVIYESEVAIDAWLSEQEEPDLLGGLGISVYRPAVPPLFDEVVADGAAERAGVKSGDRLLQADGIEMVTWMDWVDYVRDRPAVPIEMDLLRDGQPITLTIVPASVTDADKKTIGRVGLSVKMPEMPAHMLRHFDRGPVESLIASVDRTGEMVFFTLNSMKKMVMGLISPKNLSGPITIAKVASASAKSGLESFVSFLALLSVSLGVLNLLPVPVLDGGHLLYYTIEWIVGRPVPEKIQMFGYQVGLFLVLGIMMLALYNDLSRL